VQAYIFFAKKECSSLANYLILIIYAYAVFKVRTLSLSLSLSTKRTDFTNEPALIKPKKERLCAEENFIETISYNNTRFK